MPQGDIISRRHTKWNIRSSPRAELCGLTPCIPEPPESKDCGQPGWWNQRQTLICPAGTSGKLVIQPGRFHSLFSQDNANQLAIEYGFPRLVCHLESRRDVQFQVWSATWFGSRRRVLWEVEGAPVVLDHPVVVSPNITDQGMGSAQYSATVANTEDQSVTWTLSCPIAGHTTDPSYVGTITSGGLWSSPYPYIHGGYNVTVRATSVAFPAWSGTDVFFLLAGD